MLAQRNLKVNELTNTPISANAANGALITWAMLDFSTDTFTIQTQVRKARQLLLAEMSKSISIVVIGEPAQRKLAAELAVYGAWVNGIMLPEHKKIDKRKPLRKIELFGFSDKQALASLKAQAEGNILCRELTVLPPNELTPALYRARVKKLAQQHGWKHMEFDLKELRKLGAGAFVAVAQGSADEDAAIVHLRYTHPETKQTVGLVGKGICFDTGGHILQPTRYMHGMHVAMNGSAVALGILLTASQGKLPVNID
ncbi:Aminopeptidase PepA-related protein [Candidatus Nitrotoga sp. M5]|nr:Aminopeptidase PepA-related protein [Candidatus Nitrotoga sp. M5]